jgi:EmrB/QacA subfamily drug resistance transporter
LDEDGSATPEFGGSGAAAAIVTSEITPRSDARKRVAEGTSPRLSQHWLVFSIAATAVFLLSLDSTLIPIVLSDIGRGTGRTAPSQLSWIVSVYTILMASTLVAVGRIADRKGRRTTFLVGLALFLVGSAIGGTAQAYEQVLVARGVQGIGAAFVFPSSLALVLAVWPKNDTTRVIGMWTAVGAIAGSLGPSFGSWFVDTLGWRAAFLVHLPIGGIALVRAATLRVDTERQEHQRLPDLLGIVMVALVLGSAALALSQGRSWGWTDGRIVAAIAIALTMGPLLWWRCRHHESPVFDPEIFRMRTFRRIAVLSVVIPAGIFANYVMFPQYLGRVWGYSTFEIGMAIVPFSVAASLSAVAVVRVAKRFDERLILVVGMVMMICAVLFLRFVPGEEPAYWTEFLPAIVLSGIGGWGIGLAIINGLGARDLDDSNYGSGIAILMTGRQCGSLAGVATAFGILGETSLSGSAARDQLHEVWNLLVVVFLVAALLALRIPRRGAGGD